MVACKYFQQGYCRYGPSCRFEHVYGSKYNYQANAPPQQTQSGVSDEQLLNQVQLDAQAVLKGGQWLLSSYAPFKEKPIFPGISDLSPEEARLFIYEAQASNKLDQAVGYMDKLVKDTKYKYESLLKPTVEITNVLRGLYRGDTVNSPFGTSHNVSGNSSNNAASIFRGAIQSAPVATIGKPSVFGQQQSVTPKSIFAQANQNIFGSSQLGPQNSGNVTAKSLFAQANQNVFGSNVPQQNNSTNIFASSTQPNIFQQPQQQTSPFNNASTNIFSNSQSKSIFSNSINSSNEKDGDNLKIYSKSEDLTEDDLEEFKSECFKLGFIPEVPPPHFLCV